MNNQIERYNKYEYYSNLLIKKNCIYLQYK